MKSVGTINEILDLFYNKVDNISIHTKHTVANGKYGYELKDGILYCRGKQIGVCNKFVPFVIRLHDIEDYLYSPLVKLKNQKIRGKTNIDIYNVCRQNSEVLIANTYGILTSLWNGVNQNLTVTRHILEKDVTNQRFADVRIHQIKYNNARKGWRSALKDILSICKEYGLDADTIINRTQSFNFTYVEYRDFAKNYTRLSSIFNLKDNIRITLSPKENLIISGKILYWQTIRAKKVILPYCRNYTEFKKLWNNRTTRKELKSIIKIKFNEYLDNQKAIEEEKAKKYREELEVLIQEFRDYKISSIPYKWRQYGTYAVMRYESTNGVVRLWNDAVIKLKDFTDFAHFFAACVQNNIQLNRKTCYNYKIQFGGYYIWEVQANDLWNAMWGDQCITIMDVIIICNRIGISLEEYKVTRKQLLSQFEKRQEV
ncbi:hypothetical protein M1M58_gp53 [uncultured phage cr13_1]|uniref:Uncharacterized protein n=1 Tax=uncultured phage cr13_1 TaxID=2986396 RepID=A0AAE7V4K4_9CAUD|nr:hypothetical protein M1M58_gp53 [uncultured phage cr13_1]QWM90523.1 hypothetical protein [uncultured phage cr13_1]